MEAVRKPERAARRDGLAVFMTRPAPEHDFAGGGDSVRLLYRVVVYDPRRRTVGRPISDAVGSAPVEGVFYGRYLRAAFAHEQSRVGSGGEHMMRTRISGGRAVAARKVEFSAVEHEFGRILCGRGGRRPSRSHLHKRSVRHFDPLRHGPSRIDVCVRAADAQRSERRRSVETETRRQPARRGDIELVAFGRVRQRPRADFQRAVADRRQRSSAIDSPAGKTEHAVRLDVQRNRKLHDASDKAVRARDPKLPGIRRVRNRAAPVPSRESYARKVRRRIRPCNDLDRFAGNVARDNRSRVCIPDHVADKTPYPEPSDAGREAQRAGSVRHGRVRERFRGLERVGEVRRRHRGRVGKLNGRLSFGRSGKRHRPGAQVESAERTRRPFDDAAAADACELRIAG